MSALIRNVMRENLRNRVLYILAGISLLLMWLILTGQGSTVSVNGENLLSSLEGTMRVGFTFIGILGALVTVVLSMNTIPREFERQTIHLLLVRPLARWQLAVAFLMGNILTAWIFILGLSIPLFAALQAKEGGHLAGSLLLALAGPLLNSAIVATLTTLLSTRVPGPAAAFLSLLLCGGGSFGEMLTTMADTQEGIRGWLMQVGVRLVPPMDGVTAEVVKWLGGDATLNGEPLTGGLLYLLLAAGLTAVGLYGREV